MMVCPTDFVARETGFWQMEEIRAIAGEGLAFASSLDVVDGDDKTSRENVRWVLRGTAGNLRYTTRSERDRLDEHQRAPRNGGTRRAVLIAICKSGQWWSMAQDERRAIIQEKSAHFEIGMDYLPAVERRLYHSRELGEPFDFVTWFEFQEGDTPGFDALLSRLRATDEWRFVTREVEIRLLTR